MKQEATPQLIAACRAGEARAQRQLFDLLQDRMMNICLRYTRDRDEAHAHFVQGMAKILLNLHRFPADGSFESWASRVMINNTLNTLRQQKRYLQRVAFVGEEFIPERDASLNAFELQANADDVLDLIGQLPDATREVFMLYAVDGFAHKEIAGLLRISEGTSKWHVSEARKRLTVLIHQRYNHSPR